MSGRRRPGAFDQHLMDGWVRRYLPPPLGPCTLPCPALPWAMRCFPRASRARGTEASSFPPHQDDGDLTAEMRIPGMGDFDLQFIDGIGRRVVDPILQLARTREPGERGGSNQGVRKPVSPVSSGWMGWHGWTTNTQAKYRSIYLKVSNLEPVVTVDRTGSWGVFFDFGGFVVLGVLVFLSFKKPQIIRPCHAQCAFSCEIADLVLGCTNGVCFEPRVYPPDWGYGFFQKP